MIAFAVDVQHAFDLALAFEECGIRAAAVHGGTPSEERRDVLARFAGGRLRVLVNCSILLEGFDDPDIEGVIMARPTDSYALYAQAIGRALRLPRHNRRKINALVLDVTDNCRRHKLKTAFDLLGSTSTRNDAAGADVLALAEADETAEEARQEELRLRVASRPVSWRLESVCPWPELPTLDGYTPSAPWHGEPATDEQTKYLRRLGLEVRRGLTRGEASWLIDRGRTLDAGFPAPASPKMQFFLRLHGEWEDGMTKREAGRRIGRIKKQQKVEG